MKKIALIFLMSLFSVGTYAQLPLEGFETWPPANWIIDDNGVGLVNSWSQSNATPVQPPYDGSYAAYINREIVIGIAEDWLITPVFNVPTNAELSFFSRLTTNTDDGTTYRVMVIDATDDPADFTNYDEVQHWTEFEINPSQQTYFEKKILLDAALSGTSVRLAFVMSGNDGDRWLIDNVKVAEKCFTPFNLTASEVGLTTALLNWDNPSGTDTWEIEIVPVGTPATGVGESYTGTLPFLAEGLDENTEYRYYVRSVCGEEVSELSEPKFFNTIYPGHNCYAPLGISALPFSTIDNTVNYGDYYGDINLGVPGENCGNATGINFFSGNEVVYEYTAAFTGIISLDINATPATGLFVYTDCDNIGYECATGGATSFFGNHFFIPEFEITTGQTYYIIVSSQAQSTPFNLVIQQVTCDAPVGLPTTGQDYTSAQLSWTNPTDAAAWEVVVQAANAGIPAGAGEPTSTNTNYLVDELTPATSYEYYVRSDCGDDTFSPWAGPYIFNTTICEPSEQCEYTFALFNNMGNNGNEAVMTVSQNGIAVATLTLPDNAGPEYITVPLCKDKPFELFWTAPGFTPDEIEVTIINSFGQQIFTTSAGIPYTMLYEGTVNCDTPSCVTPEMLTASNPTLTSVDLGWDGPATGNWEYYVVEAGETDPNNVITAGSTTTNPVTVNGLEPATMYEFYVRMACDGGIKSEWNGPKAFSTAICASEDQCMYKFIMASNGSGWGGNTMTISQNGTNVAVIGNGFNFGNGPVEVEVPLCNGIPFQLYWNTGGNNPSQVGVSIANPFGQIIYVMDFASTSPGNVLYTGNADCINPACMPPVGLTATGATMTTIDLGWDNIEGASWQYYIAEAGDPAPAADATGTPTNETPVTADGLTAATNYEYYVKLECADGSTSAWAGPFAFSTMVCEPAEKCDYAFEMTSQIGWGWENNTMTIRQNGVAVATIGEDFTFGNSSTVVIPLCPDIPTEIVWNNDGMQPFDKGLNVYTSYMEDFFSKPAGTGEQGTIIYTGTLSCAAPLCAKPTELTASDITQTSAQLGWTENGTATSWEIWAVPTGSPEPTAPGTIVTNNPHPMEGLTPGTPYDFYVRALCEGDNGNSTLSGPSIFATIITNDECATAINLPVNPGIECITSVGGVFEGATSSGILSQCSDGMPPLADVWYSFTATAESHSLILNNFGGEVTPLHAIYGGGCDGLTELYCGYDTGGSTVDNLTIGETYYVQVYLAGGFPPQMPNGIAYFNICVLSPSATSIIIDQETHTVEQIVTDILINSECGQVSNITSRTGTDFPDIESNGIAYFNRGATDFPLEEGILLTTGKASQVKGPNVTVMGDGNWWPGDDQLFEYIQDSGINPFLMSLNQASVLEFDFVAVSDKLRFPFVFASEEYSFAQCFISDAFAFFLTDEDGNMSNLAVVPGTNTPVSVITIRDEAYGDPNYPFPCPSVNAEYFDKSYGPYGASLDPLTSPTNYNGYTKVLYAQATVVPGQTYHLKMVVADDFTTALDSGVFIGKFDIGSFDLGMDLTVENGTAICQGEQITLHSGLNADEYSSEWAFEWSLDGEIIPGEINPDLIVTEAGEYSLTVQYGITTCKYSDSVIVEFYAPIEDVTGNPADLFACNPDGFATFDLSENTSAILDGVNPADYVVSYHLSETAARENTAALELSYENETQFLQVIYVRIYNNITGCYGIKTFSLIVEDLTPEFEINDDFMICEGASGTITVEPGNFDPADVIFSWTLNGGALPDTTPAITVTQGGVYQVTVNNFGCTAVNEVTVTTTPAPVADDPEDTAACGTYTLPVLNTGNNYYTGINATGTMLSAGDIITNTQTIYVYTEIGTAPNTCSDENSFVVTIITTPEIEITQGCDGNNFTLTAVITDGVYNPEDVTFEWTNGNGITVGTEQSLVVTARDTYTVTVTPSGDVDCSTELEVIVDNTTCEIPRGISPNGDDYNNELDLTGMNIRKLSIFNRFGQEVYTKGNYTNQWHGQGNNGDGLPTATYYYSIELENGQSKTGWIYINREE